LLFAEVATASRIDLRDALEAEAQLLAAQTQRAKITMASDRSCLLLESIDPHEVDRWSGYQKHHGHLKHLLVENALRARDIADRMPTRLESAKALANDMENLLRGPMAPERIVELLTDLEQASTASSRQLVERKLLSWKSTLLSFVSEVEVKYSSFPDVWELASFAVLHVVAGFTALKDTLPDPSVSSARDISMMDKARTLNHACFSRSARFQDVEFGNSETAKMYLTSDFVDLFRVRDSEKVGHLNLHELIHFDLKNSTFEFKEKDSSFCGTFLSCWLSEENLIKTRQRLSSGYSELYSETLRAVCADGRPRQRAEIEVLMMPCHARALSDSVALMQAQTERLDKSASSLAVLASSVKATVETKLLTQWPENAVLNDIVKEADSVLQHSPFTSSKKQFQVSMRLLRLSMTSEHGAIF
jgi:hypothetical protein